jgi:hypothetical protein
VPAWDAIAHFADAIRACGLDPQPLHDRGRCRPLTSSRPARRMPRALNRKRPLAQTTGRLSIIASDRTAADGRTFHSELTWLKV